MVRYRVEVGDNESGEVFGDYDTVDEAFRKFLEIVGQGGNPTLRKLEDLKSQEFWDGWDAYYNGGKENPYCPTEEKYSYADWKEGYELAGEIVALLSKHQVSWSNVF